MREGGEGLWTTRFLREERGERKRGRREREEEKKRRKGKEEREDKRKKKQGRGTKGVTYGQVPHYHGERVVVDGTELSSARVTWPTKRVLRERGRTFTSLRCYSTKPTHTCTCIWIGGEGYNQLMVDLLT